MAYPRMPVPIFYNQYHNAYPVIHYQQPPGAANGYGWHGNGYGWQLDPKAWKTPPIYPRLDGGGEVVDTPVKAVEEPLIQAQKVTKQNAWHDFSNSRFNNIGFVFNGMSEQNFSDSFAGMNPSPCDYVYTCCSSRGRSCQRSPCTSRSSSPGASSLCRPCEPCVTYCVPISCCNPCNPCDKTEKCKDIKKDKSKDFLSFGGGGIGSAPNDQKGAKGNKIKNRNKNSGKNKKGTEKKSTEDDDKKNNEDSKQTKNKDENDNKKAATDENQDKEKTKKDNPGKGDKGDKEKNKKNPGSEKDQKKKDSKIPGGDQDKKIPGGDQDKNINKSDETKATDGKDELGKDHPGICTPRINQEPKIKMCTCASRKFLLDSFPRYPAIPTTGLFNLEQGTMEAYAQGPTMSTPNFKMCICHSKKEIVKTEMYLPPKCRHGYSYLFTENGADC